METSERITEAYNRCLEVGDDEGVAQFIAEHYGPAGGDGLDTEYFILAGEEPSTVFQLGIDAKRKAEELEKMIYNVPFDGDGIRIFYADAEVGEDILVTALEAAEEAMGG